MEYESPGTEDLKTLGRQLGRPVRGEVRVAARCPHGVVEVIANPPLLPDGTPFPTLFWLTCPLLQRRVSGLESGELRGLLRRKAEEVPGFAEALRQAERDYAVEREKWADRLGAGEKAREYFSGREGIGGTVAGGLKCLHAHLAHFLAGGDNPVGAEVAEELSGAQERECEGNCGPFLREEGRR
ncbi:MAG: DUF501 domain-containing protein [Actinomycetota bacterium]|nr:DUF501 domain-containing protein [Actinomycetota bacterium]